MKWSNVWLIFCREIRDQLRDRRTLFTVAVLPLLLYPLMGMVLLQASQFMREHKARLWIVGAGELPAAPALLSGGAFADELCSAKEAELLDLAIDHELPREAAGRMGGEIPAALQQLAQRRIRGGECDAVVVIPRGFGAELEAFRKALAGEHSPQVERLPQPLVLTDVASDRSRLAGTRAESILERWRSRVVRENLEAQQIPPAATDPFEVVSADVSEESSRRAAVWSKVLPFILMIWALTGAFYPAIDLCAGEKERGTLETLLSSPAERSEIAWGKLFTIMAFSMATALLNLTSMAGTGMLIVRQLEAFGGLQAGVQLGALPLASFVWLLVALPPAAALFSALSLAVAAFARSSREGQYYLMPLLLITLPLMTLPMLPAAQLDLGSSIIPVSGMMLLLRALIEGEFLNALRYVVPVGCVTGVSCYLAVRWAVHQFNDESVLFRESERLDLGVWLRHVVRDRGDTPTLGEAVLCGLLLLLIHFFAGFFAGAPSSWGAIVQSTLVVQLGFIAAPALLMTIMLTRRPLQTLSLDKVPPLWTLPAAAALAAGLHPAAVLLGGFIEQLYPMSPQTRAALEPISEALRAAPLPAALLLIGLTPAVCEELAFRGFILSGLRRGGWKWAAIVLSSALFGINHGILQQSIAASIVGVVIAYVVIHSGSLWTGVVFHAVYNSLSVLLQRVTEAELAEQAWLRLLFAASAGGDVSYRWQAVLIGSLAGVCLLALFRRIAPAESMSRPAQDVAWQEAPPRSAAGSHVRDDFA